MTLPIEQYASELEDKRQRLTEVLAPFDAPAIEVFDSPPEHFRQRAEFRIWHDGEDCCYAMFEPGQKPSAITLRRIDHFPIASRAICKLMQPLLEALKASELGRKKLYQIEFLGTQSGDMLVTLIYHKRLDETWEAMARTLQSQFDIAIIGRSRGQKLTLVRDHVLETFAVAGRRYDYRQIEGGFSQPNAAVCEKMLNWANDCAGQMNAGARDLLELYCGNGNFTLPLSQNFRRTFATELAKSSVRAARWNIEHNGIETIDMARLSSEEFTRAWRGERRFRRLEQQGIELDNYDFGCLFVDPPRSGMDEDTCRLATAFDQILYISCNPESLADNLEILGGSHCIRRAALFDQFPWTGHIEAGVWLERKAP
ncbi:MAG: tRNA (uridine(54)-C5)-methyltransferase TrmA [Pseudomonadota bacterium]